MGSRRKPQRTKKQKQQPGTSRGIIIIIGVSAIAVIGLGYLLFMSLRGPQAPTPISGVHEHPPQERGHVDQEIEAGPLPPVGGIHNPVWQNCGIYDEPVDIAHAVHSMEHGAMWLTYQPDLPQDEVEKLRDYVRGEDYALMSPYPGLQSPIVLTAWEVQLELDSADDERIPEFVERYQKGPTTPELGATCQDGEGTPIG